MIYIFEDMKEDILSEFFRKAYPSKIADKFIYTNGNGGIKSTAKELLETTQDTIIVFWDFYPTNKSIVDIYRDLRKKSIAHDNRIIVLPIVCAEFYILKLLRKNEMITDENKANIAFDFDLYDEILQSNEVTDSDVKFCKNFEKYCKLVTMKWVKECAKTNGTQEYYTESCVCNTLNDNKCLSRELTQKAIDYISQYPCVPAGSYTDDIKQLTVDEIWDIHRQLVNMFNKIVDKLEPIDSSRKYRKISIIK